MKGQSRRLAFALLVAAVAVLPAVSRTGSMAARGAQQQSELDKRFLDTWVKQSRVTLAVPAGNAKVVIVKFNDWMCPGCKMWYQQLKPVLAKYQASAPGAIKYVERDWPWNAQCNAAVTQTIPGHDASCAAAAAVRLAADRGKREEMAEWMYANQPTSVAEAPIVLERVKAHASQVLGLKDFAAAYATKVADIKKDIAEGMAVHVRSTPTYFINGVMAGDDNGTLPLHYFELAIQYELQQKK
jgi:protein-disulfide isomerase